MNLNRLETLVGTNNLNKIKNLNILIVGIGGVGGYAFETLVRCGIKNFTIIDHDKIDETNLNRQIIATQENIGKLKVEEAYKRALSINPNIKINPLPIFLDETSIDKINFSKYDYIIDACDTTNTKKLIIENSLKYNRKIISSMGTAKKMDATKIEITTLDKTNYDPLAKIMRKLISKEDQHKVVVVTSKEEIVKCGTLGSNSFVPATAGLFITNYIINDIIKVDKLYFL